LRHLPNLLTLLRLALTPWAAVCILRQEFGTALWVCAAAGLSDALDGWLARKLDARSRFGAYMDPISDKILLVTVFLALGAVHAAPRWLVALVLGRDLLILAMAAIALAFTSIRDFPPSLWGKISTHLQVYACLIFLSANIWPGSVWSSAVPVATAAAAAGTAWSGLHYVYTGIRRIRS
jgi:cardiolipin synthase